ncbi:MAG TPA: hypothetical protein VF832_14740 [Longimicrobiales bacterium]
MDSNRDKRAPGMVRQTDIEPYTGLKWVSRLFKAASIFLFVALVGEFIAGLRYDGVRSMPVLLGEAARTFVVAVVLWAGGDLVRLFVHLGHDIRAERVLLARLVSRTPAAEHEDARAQAEADSAGAEAAGMEPKPEAISLHERGAAD